MPNEQKAVNYLRKIVDAISGLSLSISGDSKNYTCIVRRNTLQSIPTSAWATILFNVKNNDPENGFNMTTGKYTIPISGFYIISAKSVFQPNVNGTWRLCSIFKNGIELARGSNSGGAYNTSVPIYLQQ